MARVSIQKQPDPFARGMKEIGWRMFKALMEQDARLKRNKARRLLRKKRTGRP